MSSQQKSKKQKNLQKQPLPTCTELHIQCLEKSTELFTFNSEDSILFNAYILGNLMNKTLKISHEFSVQFLGKELKLSVKNVVFSDNKDNFKDGEFCVGYGTKIILVKDMNYVDELIEDFDSKLNLHQTNKQLPPQNSLLLTQEEKEKLLDFISEKFSTGKNDNVIHSLINEDENYALICDFFSY